MPSPSFYKAEQAICYGDGREERLISYIHSHPEHAKMAGEPQAVLAAIDDFAYKHDFLMNVGHEKGQVICREINRRKPKIIVEIGGYIGYSAILFGQTLKLSGGKKYISLERNESFASIMRSMISLASLQDIVEVMVGPCRDSLEMLKQSLHSIPVDFFFLDHAKPAYVEDLRLCEDLGLVGPGTVIAADDIVNAGAPGYLEYVRASPEEKKLQADRVRDDQDGQPASRGNPNLIYSSMLHEALAPTGEQVSGNLCDCSIFAKTEKDGVEISICMGLAP